MDELRDLQIWDSVSVSVVGVKHRLLLAQSAAKLRSTQRERVRVFVFDSSAQDRAVTCARTLEDHMIRAAGGENVFGDRGGLFLPVSWKSVEKNRSPGHHRPLFS